MVDVLPVVELVGADLQRVDLERRKVTPHLLPTVGAEEQRVDKWPVDCLADVLKTRTHRLAPVAAVRLWEDKVEALLRSLGLSEGLVWAVEQQLLHRDEQVLGEGVDHELENVQIVEVDEAAGVVVAFGAAAHACVPRVLRDSVRGVNVQAGSNSPG